MAKKMEKLSDVLLGHARLLYKSQADWQYFICLNVNDKLHKIGIFGRLTMNNYEVMVVTWGLNGNCLTKGTLNTIFQM